MLLKKNQSIKKGFTLIELLVVIAIIGILSSIVIVNLNSARNKGQDASIKQQIGQIRSATALYEDTNNAFSSVNVTQSTAAAAATCSTADTIFTDSSIARAITGITNNAGAAPNCALGLGISPGPAQSWVIISTLRSSATDFWCADSSGIAKVVNSKTAITNSGGEVTCP